MSDQEIGELMDNAEQENEVTNTSGPDTSEPDTTDTFLNVSDCINVIDYVLAHTDLISNWKKVDISLNGIAITDTKGMLVGVDSDNVPLTFNCKNLMIPNSKLNGITSISVNVSGIIMTSPTAIIYVTKNNIFVYSKNADGRTTDSTIYYKVKNSKISYKNYIPDHVDSTPELAKLTFKVGCGRIYALIHDLNDINEIRNKVIEFLKNKVTDINYSIKIENMCYQLNF